MLGDGVLGGREGGGDYGGIEGGEKGGGIDVSRLQAGKRGCWQGFNARDYGDATRNLRISFS